MVTSAASERIGGCSRDYEDVIKEIDPEGVELLRADVSEYAIMPQRVGTPG